MAHFENLLQLMNASYSALETKALQLVGLWEWANDYIMCEEFGASSRPTTMNLVYLSLDICIFKFVVSKYERSLIVQITSCKPISEHMRLQVRLTLPHVIQKAF